MPAANIDHRRLPFGLVRYKPGVFEEMHRAGSGLLTASGVPALLGQSRFTSRYAYMAHVMGLHVLREQNERLTWRGKLLERPLLEDVVPEERPTWRVSQIRAFARCPGLPGLVASPDAIVTDEERSPIGILEGKIVARRVFQEEWLGSLPVDIQLQQQAQFLCTGAKWGAIVVGIVSEFDFEPIIYETTPDPAVLEVLREVCGQALADIRDARLPDPDDSSATARALLSVYPTARTGKAVTVARDEEGEAMRRWTAWQQARLDGRAAEATVEACRNWFLARAGDADRVVIGGAAEVRIAAVRRSERTIAAGVEKRMTLVDHVTGEGHDEPAKVPLDMLPPLF